MTWLTSPAAVNSNDTRIDVYRDKQNRYTDAFERKLKAFDDALARAMKDPANNTSDLQRAAYDKWVAENEKTYNNNVQAAYMDWVTLGKKEEVEYYFAIVDNDSAMARVEASKACGLADAALICSYISPLFWWICRKLCVTPSFRIPTVQPSTTKSHSRLPTGLGSPSKRPTVHRGGRPPNL